MSGPTFWFSTSFVNVPISYRKQILKNFLWLYLSQMWATKATIPSGGDMMTHTKREPRARPRNPFLCRKTILESIKSFSISDLDKYPII